MFSWVPTSLYTRPTLFYEQLNKNVVDTKITKKYAVKVKNQKLLRTFLFVRTLVSDDTLNWVWPNMFQNISQSFFWCCLYYVGQTSIVNYFISALCTCNTSGCFKNVQTILGVWPYISCESKLLNLWLGSIFRKVFWSLIM